MSGALEYEKDLQSLFQEDERDEKIKESEKKIEELRQKLEKNIEKNKILKKKKNELKFERNQYESIWDFCKKEKEMMKEMIEKEKGRSNAKVEELRQKLNESEEKEREKDEIITKKDKKLNKRSERIKMLEEENGSLREEREILKREKTALEKTIATMSKEIISLKEIIKQNDEEIKKLQENLLIMFKVTEKNEEYIKLVLAALGARQEQFDALCLEHKKAINSLNNSELQLAKAMRSIVELSKKLQESENRPPEHYISYQTLYKPIYLQRQYCLNMCIIEQVSIAPSSDFNQIPNELGTSNQEYAADTGSKSKRIQ